MSNTLMWLECINDIKGQGNSPDIRNHYPHVNVEAIITPSTILNKGIIITILPTIPSVAIPDGNTTHDSSR